MTKKSYSRRSYRRRRTNKKNKITRLKSKKKSYKKSYKKGGMFASFRGLVDAAEAAPPAPPLVDEEDHLIGDCTDISGMQGLFDIVASRDVRTLPMNKRPAVSPDDVIFDRKLEAGNIVEVNHGKGDNIRWFGVIYRRAVKSKGGVYVKWFKEINKEGETFSLELDKSQLGCDFVNFYNIIGIVEF